MTDNPIERPRVDPLRALPPLPREEIRRYVRLIPSGHAVALGSALVVTGWLYPPARGIFGDLRFSPGREFPFFAMIGLALALGLLSWQVLSRRRLARPASEGAGEISSPEDWMPILHHPRWVLLSGLGTLVPTLAATCLIGAPVAGLPLLTGYLLALTLAFWIVEALLVQNVLLRLWLRKRILPRGDERLERLALSGELLEKAILVPNGIGMVAFALGALDMTRVAPEFFPRLLGEPPILAYTTSVSLALNIAWLARSRSLLKPIESFLRELVRGLDRPRHPPPEPGPAPARPLAAVRALYEQTLYYPYRSMGLALTMWMTGIVAGFVVPVRLALYPSLGGASISLFLFDACVVGCAALLLQLPLQRRALLPVFLALGQDLVGRPADEIRTLPHVGLRTRLLIHGLGVVGCATLVSLRTTYVAAGPMDFTKGASLASPVLQGLLLVVFAACVLLLFLPEVVGPTRLLEGSVQRVVEGFPEDALALGEIDEIGRTVHAVEAMKRSLARAVDQLMGITRHQEEKVRERTLELKDANSRLTDRAELMAERGRRLEEALGELRTAQLQLMGSERMSSLGRMVAGVAHEINNPLNFVTSNLRVLGLYLDALDSDSGTDLAPGSGCPNASGRSTRALPVELAPLVRSTVGGVERMRGIVADLRRFARTDGPAPTATDLHKLIDSTLKILASPFRGRIEVMRDFDDGLPSVVCHPGQIQQVLVNLLDNAAQAIDERGTVRVSTRREEDGVRIEIEDTGRGIPAGMLERIFEPFLTTRSSVAGTGLGLSVSNAIVAAHGGRIEVKSELGRGSVFTVRLRLQPPAWSEGRGAEAGEPIGP